MRLKVDLPQRGVEPSFVSAHASSPALSAYLSLSRAQKRASREKVNTLNARFKIRITYTLTNCATWISAQEIRRGCQNLGALCFHAEFIRIFAGARLLYARSDYSADLAHLNARSQWLLLPCINMFDAKFLYGDNSPLHSDFWSWDLMDLISNRFMEILISILGWHCCTLTKDFILRNYYHIFYCLKFVYKKAILTNIVRFQLMGEFYWANSRICQ